MDDLNDFRKFLESIGAKVSVKALSLSNKDLVSEKIIDTEAGSFEVLVFQVGDTKVTVETKLVEAESEGLESDYKESIKSIIEDLNEEIAYAVENEKFELAAELKRKRDFLAKKL